MSPAYARAQERHMTVLEDEVGVSLGGGKMSEESTVTVEMIHGVEQGSIMLME